LYFNKVEARHTYIRGHGTGLEQITEIKPASIDDDMSETAALSHHLIVLWRHFVEMGRVALVG